MPKEHSKQRSKMKQRINTVPYVKGYHPPSSEEQIKAIGFKTKNLPVEYSDMSIDSLKFFSPIPQPTTEDDWLAQYLEEGQSFREYLLENPWFSKRKGKFMRQKFEAEGKTICERYPDGKIYIAKFGSFKSSDINFDDLIDYVKKFLCVPVHILEGMDIIKKDNELVLIQDPQCIPSSRPGARVKRSTLDTRFNAQTKHIQIGVDSILPKMHSMIPPDALCLIGLTPYDLYGDETDLFVAGMAAGNRRVAIFSLLRYNPALTFSKEFWYEIVEDNNIDLKEKQKLILQRCCKLVVHELCHLLGLPHCIYFRCCMNGSGHLSEDFNQPMMLCPVDLHKLQALIGFDIVDRYQNLLDFYQKHGFREEAEWTNRRIKYIQSQNVNYVK
ncbi:unnamed protein product [Lymnaea stagnalis]|uniref:Archaemetzincin-2 n=1 Tax=Lymnaea stagnalis TaxID=6523 RepID=A0AAV2H6I2_LYMST